MISRDKLPEDAADWTDVNVSFDRLSDDSAQSCPKPEDEVFEYVRMESADTDSADRSRFRFARTALVGDSKYWLWEYTEEDGQLCYVVFQIKPDGTTILGFSEPNGLSQEQYLLADYYEEIYWS